MTTQLKHLTIPIIVAVAEMIDDSSARGQRDVAPDKARHRPPSHNDLTNLFDRHNLKNFDPRESGESVGKAKRLRAVLTAARENSLEERGGLCITELIGQIKGVGGFIPGHHHYVGEKAIQTMDNALRDEGFQLMPNGDMLQLNLDPLQGRDLTEALRGYIRRAIHGDQDAALAVGNSKDLLEATIKHCLDESNISYKEKESFPNLITTLFSCWEVSNILPPDQDFVNMKRLIVDMACAVNFLRNKKGTGHGRPQLAELTLQQAKFTVQVSGVITEFMLDLLESRRKG